MAKEEGSNTPSSINFYNAKPLVIATVSIVLAWVWITTYFIPRTEHAILVQRDHADMVRTDDIRDFITRTEVASVYVTRVETSRVTNELLLGVYQLELNGYNDKVRRGEKLGPLEEARYAELKESVSALLLKKQHFIIDSGKMNK